MRRKLQFFPTCGSPDKTHSFRATTRTTTAAAAAGEFQEMAATGEPTGEIETSIEPVIRGLSSDRFFFKPGKTSSILDEAKEKEKVLEFKESVSMMEMESTDPFVDFKKSMQEMMEADEGLKEWDNLQELLSLYLAVNDKINHGYIIRAFVDLMLVNFGATSSSSSSSLAPSSCSSSSSLNVKDESLLMEESNKKMIISSKSPESALSFTSSSASSSGTCSSTSNCLSSCSLEGDEEEEEDDNSVQKEVDSDNASSFSSSKV